MGTQTSATDQLAQLKRRLASEKHLIDKLKAIRSLHVTSYNSSLSVQEMAIEFYYAIGDILEGQKPGDLNLKAINKEEFLKELTDG